MNHAEKQYALKRIDEIKNNKIQLASSRYRIPEVRLNDKQEYDLIASGKVKLLPYEKVANRGSYIERWFDFSKFENESSYKEPIFTACVKNIRELATSARDQIMLGDCAEALKLIQQLESIKI